MRVDVIHTENCPHLVPTVDRIRAVAARLGVDVDLRLVLVASVDEARRLHFLGSPTVRVNDVDIDPNHSNRDDFGLSCRVYAGRGVPPESMIAAALGERV